MARRHQRSKCTSGRAGFTLTELLVVIAIIAVLVGLVLIASGPIRRGALRTRCLANQREIAHASLNYATDNNSWLPSPRTDKLPPEGGMGVVFNPWVNCTQSAGTLTSQNVELKGSLEKGVLWEYMNANHSVYRSPMDPTSRVRSYSLNCFVGVGAVSPNPANRRADDLYSYGEKTYTLSKVMQPAKTMYSLTEEDAPGYNRHGWVLNPGTNMGTVAKWVDLPSFWDGNRINMSLMDGSVTSLNILSAKLIKAMDNWGNNYIEPQPAPAFKVMRQYMLPGNMVHGSAYSYQ